MNYRVGDVVRKINSYWYGRMGEPKEDYNKLYVISGVSGGYEIRSLDTGGTEAWWHDDQLEYVRHEDDNIFKKLDDIYNHIVEQNRDLCWIKENYPNVPSSSFLKLFEEIGYHSSFVNNGEFFILYDDIQSLMPIFDGIFNNDIDAAYKAIDDRILAPYRTKYKGTVKELYRKIQEV